MSSLLIDLLAQRLPRGQRCQTCINFEPAEVGDGYGECAHQIATYVHAHDRCALWEPREECSLDGLGIPLASPASMECDEEEAVNDPNLLAVAIDRLNAAIARAEEAEARAATYTQQSVDALGVLHRLVYLKDVLKASDPAHYAAYKDEAWEAARRVLAKATLSDKRGQALLALPGAVAEMMAHPRSDFQGPAVPRVMELLRALDEVEP